MINGKKMTKEKRKKMIGWFFIAPAAFLILWMSFYPMLQALILSFKTGIGNNLVWAGLYNYRRLFSDSVFMTSLGNTFLYLLIQVPIMLIMGLVFASLLNMKDIKFKGLFRTAIFLPCCTSLVSYAIIFKSMFAYNGFANTVLLNLGLIGSRINWLGETNTAKAILIIALLWRWTGYNMVFYLAGLQNIDNSIYEAARIDGANSFQIFRKMTIPQLKPTILLTLIMSTNGTLQLFDESVNLTNGGPANSTLTMAHYIYKVSFGNSSQFGYAAALSYVIFILVAILALIQMKVGDKRD